MFQSWTHPWILYLALPAFLAIAIFWPRRPAIGLELPAAAQNRDLSSRRTQRRQRWLKIALGAAGVLLIVALAGPRTTTRLPARAEGITLALVVDISGSMATPDFALDGEKVSRLTGVQRIFRLLVVGGTANGFDFRGRPNDLIGLVTFAVRPDTACPPTLDHAALLAILDRQKPKTVVGESTTNPGDALAWALSALQKAPTRRKAIVFLTDGESNVPAPALTPLQAARIAADLKIPIYAIDALDDAEAGADAPKAHATLAEVARLTGGQHFRATDGAGLQMALHELDRFERDLIVRPDNVVHGDLSMPVAFAAFACWLASIVGRATWGRGSP